MWKIHDDEWVDTVLILLYMGWRISEMLGIRTENIDLENRTIRSGVKTKNGKNRIVPIHPRIYPFILKRYNPDADYLFPGDTHTHITSANYYVHWQTVMRKLNFSHTPHECRHTFRSRLDSAGANKTCIDLLMGHKSGSVGERVYTHKTVAELAETIILLR